VTENAPTSRSLPTGFRTHPSTTADAPAIHRPFTAYEENLHGHTSTARDTVLVFDSAGEVAGWGGREGGGRPCGCVRISEGGGLARGCCAGATAGRGPACPDGLRRRSRSGRAPRRPRLRPDRHGVAPPHRDARRTRGAEASDGHRGPPLPSGRRAGRVPGHGPGTPSGVRRSSPRRRRSPSPGARWSALSCRWTSPAARRGASSGSPAGATSGGGGSWGPCCGSRSVSFSGAARRAASCGGTRTRGHCRCTSASG